MIKVSHPYREHELVPLVTNQNCYSIMSSLVAWMWLVDDKCQFYFYQRVGQNIHLKRH